MNIALFNKSYWVRRFTKQTIVKGYAKTEYADFVARLHLHPVGTDEIAALPEGQRKVKRLEGHGNTKLYTADQEKEKKGDLVFYYGSWYECVSCQFWDHTLLSHYNYQFVIVPTDASGAADLVPPKSLPGEEV